MRIDGNCKSRNKLLFVVHMQQFREGKPLLVVTFFPMRLGICQTGYRDAELGWFRAGSTTVKFCLGATGTWIWFLRTIGGRPAVQRITPMFGTA